MAVSMAAVMRHVRNYFERGYIDGTFTVSGGMLTPAPQTPYFAVQGSLGYDGVYSVFEGLPENMPETFTGRVWLLHPPDDFVSLCEQISAYDDKNPVGALQSETFGEYSYTRYNGYSGPQTWQTAFAAYLTPYRRMFTEVEA